MKRVDKAALAAGATTSAATTGTFIAVTASLSGPAANLGGYATAQIVVGSTVSSLAGPALATVISTVGGPVVAGGIVVVGAGALVFGGVKLIGRLFGSRPRYARRYR